MLFDAAIITVIAGLLWLFILRLLHRPLPTSCGKLDFRLAYFFAGAFSVQLILALLGMKGVVWAQRIFPAAYVVSYLVLLFAGFHNWRLLGMRIALLGISLNFLVITANGGHMPANADLVRQTGAVNASLLENKAYARQRPITDRSRLTCLGDVILLPHPYPRPCVFSIGDLFITLGACWLILSALGLVPQSCKREIGEASATAS